MSDIRTRIPRAAACIGAALLFLGFLTAFALQAGDADAKAAERLGATKKTPAPACPKGCTVAASVTGFQTVADGKGSPFTVPSNGHLVAWSMDIGNPSSDDTDIFDGFFPDNKYKGKAAARLSVLKPKRKGRFKLTKQSPPIELQSRFGSQPIIALGNPLKVKKGQRIALTVPTWAPVYQFNLPNGDNQWLASRQPDKCSGDQAKKAKPQQKKGSTRKYGCRFNGERLLYWAYFVPNGKKKK